jgi:hypothetical protein
VPSTQQTFAEVPPAGTFWLWVERLSTRALIGGYPCGSPVRAVRRPAGPALLPPQQPCDAGAVVQDHQWRGGLGGNADRPDLREQPARQHVLSLCGTDRCSGDGRRLSPWLTRRALYPPRPAAPTSPPTTRPRGASPVKLWP